MKRILTAALLTVILLTASAFGATGAAGEFNAAPQSKNEMKEGCGMKAISPSGVV